MEKDMKIEKRPPTPEEINGTITVVSGLIIIVLLTLVYFGIL